jgi:putative FmdB family regulatory protein
VPLYDYECRNCGHRVEVLHGVNGTGPTACEQCGGPMRKLLNTPAIVFKGSGWAKKDRSSSSSKGTEKSPPAASGDSGKASETGTKSESGRDSGSPKSDTKSETKTSVKADGPGAAGSAD